MPPSSRGLGHLPFTEATGIRIPLGVLKKRKNEKKFFWASFLLLILKILQEVLTSLAIHGKEKHSREFVEGNSTEMARPKLHLWQYGGVVLCP